MFIQVISKLTGQCLRSDYKAHNNKQFCLGNQVQKTFTLLKTQEVSNFDYILYNNEDILIKLKETGYTLQ